MSKSLFKPTNNVTRATFEHVRDNPGCTRIQMIKALEAQGYKESSVSSLIRQMQVSGLIQGGSTTGYYATAKEYTPLKAYKVYRRQQRAIEAAREAAKIKNKPGPAKGTKYGPRKVKATQVVLTPEEQTAILLGSPTPAPAPKAVQASEPKLWTAQQALDGLSVLQAKALYDELKKLFG